MRCHKVWQAQEHVGAFPASAEKSMAPNSVASARAYGRAHRVQRLDAFPLHCVVARHAQHRAIKQDAQVKGDLPRQPART
eukprot:350672-Chlamydomonas_euryale.AAC.5